jgi:hypothetical protein
MGAGPGADGEPGDKREREEDAMTDVTEARFHPQYITNEQGERVSVVLPLGEFNELLEDLADLAVVAERRDEPTVTMDELEAGLKADGIV